MSIEDPNSGFTINVVDLNGGKKRKPMHDPNIRGKCVSLGFSFDGRYIFAQSSAPESLLSVWLVEKVLELTIVAIIVSIKVDFYRGDDPTDDCLAL
jgi:hypothetical protein